MTLVKRLPADLVTKVENERDPLRVRRQNLRALLRVARTKGVQHQRRAFTDLSERFCDEVVSGNTHG